MSHRFACTKSTVDYFVDMGRVVRFLFGSLSLIVALIAIGIGYLKLDDVSRKKLFATLMNKMADPNDPKMMDLRCNQILKHSNVKGRVLEIGAGTGINFPCLYNNTNIQSYIGVEPNLHMHSYFNEFIEKWPHTFDIRLLNNSATDMPEIESDSIDTVIMTLVLCSVPDPLPDKVLREAYRVLKPGGKFLFLEHMLADSQARPVAHRIQRTITPVWSIIGDGCQFKPMTNYFDAVKDVYSKVEYEKFNITVPLFSVLDALKGMLIK